MISIKLITLFAKYSANLIRILYCNKQKLTLHFFLKKIEVITIKLIYKYHEVFITILTVKKCTQLNNNLILDII